MTGSHTPQDQSPGRETEAGPPPLEWQPEGPGTERPAAQWTQSQPGAAGRRAVTKRKGPERPPLDVEGGQWRVFHLRASILPARPLLPCLVSQLQAFRLECVFQKVARAVSVNHISEHFLLSPSNPACGSVPSGIKFRLHHVLHKTSCIILSSFSLAPPPWGLRGRAGDSLIGPLTHRLSVSPSPALFPPSVPRAPVPGMDSPASQLSLDLNNLAISA